MSRRQCEYNNRNYRHQSNHTKRECRISSLVQLPAESHLKHLPSDNSKHPAKKEKPEIMETESLVRVVRACYVSVLVPEVSFGGVG